MKKIKYLLLSILLFVMMGGYIYAAPSYSFNVASSVENGKNVTASVTVKNTAAWNIKINSSGNTNGCSNSWADATGNGNNATKTFTTTCKATGLGSISFTLSGDITDQDGNNIGISGSKRVSVVEPRPASKVNTLKSLTVDGYSFNEEFDEEKLEYTVNIPASVEKINIKAVKKDGYSKVDGDGEKEVEEGSNRFEINVTSESGDIRTYIITANVEDTNPINVNVGGRNYSVVKKSKNLTPLENYTETTITIDGVEVVAFRNEITNITLVALKDNEGVIYYFKYSDGKYEKYVELSSNALVLSPSNVDENKYNGWSKKEVTINDNLVEVLQYKSLDKYYLIYALDVNSGEYNYYLYDVTNNTYQLFNEELFNTLISDSNFYLYMLIGCGGLLFLCIIIIIILLSKKGNKVKKVKENNESKKEIEEVISEVSSEKKEEVKKEVKEGTMIFDGFDDISKKDIKKEKKKKGKENIQ